jgi:hypothetical protein
MSSERNINFAGEERLTPIATFATRRPNGRRMWSYRQKLDEGSRITCRVCRSKLVDAIDPQTVQNSSDPFAESWDTAREGESSFEVNASGSASAWASRFVAKEYSDMSRVFLSSEMFQRQRSGRSMSGSILIVKS